MAKRPASGGDNSGGDTPAYNPFLKSTDLRAGAVFSMTGWARRTSGKFGPQIVVEVTQNSTGKTFDFAFSDGSPNHRALFKACGPDVQTWKGTITASVKKGGYGDFVSIQKVDADNIPF